MVFSFPLVGQVKVFTVFQCAMDKAFSSMLFFSLIFNRSYGFHLTLFQLSLLFSFPLEDPDCCADIHSQVRKDPLEKASEI